MYKDEIKYLNDKNEYISLYEEGYENGYFWGGIAGIISTIIFAGIVYFIWKIIL